MCKLEAIVKIRCPVVIAGGEMAERWKRVVLCLIYQAISTWSYIVCGCLYDALWTILARSSIRRKWLSLPSKSSLSYSTHSMTIRCRFEVLGFWYAPKVLLGFLLDIVKASLRISNVNAGLKAIAGLISRLIQSYFKLADSVSCG